MKNIRKNLSRPDLTITRLVYHPQPEKYHKPLILYATLRVPRAQVKLGMAILHDSKFLVL